MILIINFIHFLKQPSKNLEKEETFLRKVFVFFICFSLAMIGLFLFSFLVIFIVSLGVDKEIFKHNTTYNETIRNGRFLALVVVTPIIEELGFRLYLTGKRHYFFISFLLVFHITVSYFIKLIMNLDINDWYIRISSFLVFSLFFFTLKNKVKLNFSSSVNFKYIYYFSCFLFAFFHLSNFYPLSTKQLIFFPLLILPQFIYGISFGYLRLKNGFLWGVALHSFINLIGFSLIYLSKQLINS